MSEQGNLDLEFIFTIIIIKLETLKYKAKLFCLFIYFIKLFMTSVIQTVSWFLSIKLKYTERNCVKNNHCKKVVWEGEGGKVSHQGS